MPAPKTAIDIIKSSLRLINALAASEALPAEEANDAFSTLNDMIDAWNAERLMIFTIKIEEFPLIVSQQVYTMGVNGDFNTARPARIDSVSIIILSNPNQPLERKMKYLTDSQWQGVPVKNIPTTVPLEVYDDGAYPLRNLSYWGIPTEAISTRIYSWTALTEFPDLVTPITYPPGYYRALRYNLATELADEWGLPATPSVIAKAIESKAAIKSINIPIVDLKCDRALTGSGAAYDWRSDSVVGSGGH